FGSLQERFGEENAGHVLAFLERWKQHYTRAAYISLGFEGEEQFAQITREMAAVNDWGFELLQGDASLLRSALSGEWTDEQLFVLPPGHRSAATGDDRLLTAVPVDAEVAPPVLAEGDVVLESAPGGGPAGGIGLGIDAGGTYTDAVIYDLTERRLLAKAKSLTTYHDLVEGIRGALSQLPPEQLARVEVTSLSTTLATNAIVEGRGHKVGLLVLAPWDWFAESIGHQPYIRVPGSVNSEGEVVEPLDEGACRVAIDQLLGEERCAALVIAGYGVLRNPEQANRLRELVAERHPEVPVICSHEVSRRLNGLRGAQTAVANARLLPIIRHLLDSVHQALVEFRVPGKLMVVKGDGTPVDEGLARARPVETILSGPAASVSGARILTGLDDALVMDIGGTTTDCAIIRDGHVAVSPDGARVGDWVMSVDVVEMCTVGLGGDSRIDFNRERELTVGPSRNLPFCALASQYDSVAAFLRGFDERYFKSAPDASALDVLALGSPTTLALAPDERALMELLAEGPRSVLELARVLEVSHHKFLPIGRLEACGAVKRGALTPTDLLHVSGRFTRWDVEAARRALEVFSAMLERPAPDVLRDALDLVTRRLFEEALRREVSSEDRRLPDLPEDWRFLLDRGFRGRGEGLGVRLSLSRPIVALGAPAGVLAPPLADHLEAKVIVPEDADVANAIGAIGTEVVVREEVVIQPGQLANYVLYATEERLEFSELSRATERAVEIARAQARRSALEAGAHAPEVTITRSDRGGTLAAGERIFLERRVVAVASGSAFGARGNGGTAPSGAPGG
ncbi:MAG TPA: hydantoinase/oxoprolinase family protein, partial [Armatimonadota bacterium]